MPARRAMSSVEAPCRPFRPNSIMAASSTVSRRWSAVWRVVVAAMRTKLAVTHNNVKADGQTAVSGHGW